uniref:Uncharacterized protein n=1 Tax=Timema poppense TaxID=170557 RepID=A0A7R9DNA7_TIMPO|nr:unnamed protein product [Timema poppensis]
MGRSYVSNPLRLIIADLEGSLSPAEHIRPSTVPGGDEEWLHTAPIDMSAIKARVDARRARRETAVIAAETFVRGQRSPGTPAGGSPMASLVPSDSSQLTTDGFEKLPDQIMYLYTEPYDLQKHVFSSCASLVQSRFPLGLRENSIACRTRLKQQLRRDRHARGSTRSPCDLDKQRVREWTERQAREGQVGRLGRDRVEREEEVREERHEVVRVERHEVVREERHEVVREERVEEVREGRHEVVREERHEVVREERHEVVREERHEVVREERHEAIRVERVQVKIVVRHQGEANPPPPPLLLNIARLRWQIPGNEPRSHTQRELYCH